MGLSEGKRPLEADKPAQTVGTLHSSKPRQRSKRTLLRAGSGDCRIPEQFEESAKLENAIDCNVKTRALNPEIAFSVSKSGRSEFQVTAGNRTMCCRGGKPRKRN